MFRLINFRSTHDRWSKEALSRYASDAEDSLEKIQGAVEEFKEFFSEAPRHQSRQS